MIFLQFLKRNQRIIVTKKKNLLRFPFCTFYRRKDKKTLLNAGCRLRLMFQRKEPLPLLAQIFPLLPASRK